jgi:3-hydroxy-9,10-secoandrosta-1,3,5(10)-triene-9,17-dione monooxygenase
MTMKERIVALAPSVRARAAELDRLRQVPAETIRELTDAGLFRALTPRRYGGTEVPLVPLFEALTELARACTSTGWVGSLLSFHSFLSARYDVRAQDELWANGPDTRIATSVAPNGEGVLTERGDVRVSGRWSYLSGVDHCTWAVLNTPVRDPRNSSQKPVNYFVLVPAADYSVEDDWHVSGLRGTGSKSVRLQDVVVPKHRAELVLGIAAGETSGLAGHPPLFKVSYEGLFPLAFAPAAIGTALATVDHYRDYTATRQAAFTGAAFRAKPTAWLRLADATAHVDAARLVLERDLEALQSATSSPRAQQMQVTERARFDVAYIVDLCSRAVDRAFGGSGGRALFETHPLQRCFRDMHAITQHAATSFDDAAERYGQYLLASGRT